MSSEVNNKKFVILGAIASLSLLSIYFTVFSIASSFLHALESFIEIWYWLLPLIIGFGFQVGFYFYIRDSFRFKKMASPTATVATSGGISAGSMIACCLHYITNILPLLGLVVLTTFLATYQLFFIIIGILSNLIGITIMLEIIQKHNLSEGFFKKILIYDMNKIKKITIGLSLVLAVVAFLFIGRFLGGNSSQNLDFESIENQPALEESKTINLESKINSQGGISFEATPTNFDFSNQIKFEITIDTHSGSLDFDIAKISILEDNEGNKYEPLNWQGSVPGGHHRSGTLTFLKLDASTKTMKLIIKDNPSSSSRVFEWDLK